MRKPKYRRHTSRDRAFVEYQGKRHYLPGEWKSAESLVAYREFLRRHDLLQIEASSDKPQSVAAVAGRFLEWAAIAYPTGIRSEYSNCRCAVQHLLARDRNTLVQDYGPLRLKALQQQLAHAKKSRNYINAVCARVKRMFKWAVSEELIVPSVYHALATVPGLRRGRSLAVETKPKQPVPWEHVEPILPELSPTVAAMVLMQWHTGVRPQSVCRAKVEQFDRTKDPWEWSLRHKTEHLGIVLVGFIGPKCQAVLKPFLDGRKPGEYVFQPRHLNGRRAKGFHSFYTPQSYLRAIARAIDRVNRLREQPIPHWTPHQLRHARATLVRETHGLEAAQAVLGHARLDATQLYAAKQMALARRVASETG